MRNRGRVAGVASLCLLVVGAVILLYVQAGCWGIDGPAHCYSQTHYDLSSAGLAMLYVGIFPGIFFLLELLRRN